MVTCVVSNTADRDLALQLQWRHDDMPSGVELSAGTTVRY